MASSIEREKYSSMKRKYKISDESIKFIKSLGFKKIDDDIYSTLYDKLLSMDAQLGNKEERTTEDDEKLRLVYNLLCEFDCEKDDDVELDLDYINEELAK